MRQIRFLFQEPGLLEAIALDQSCPKPQNGLNTPGYRSLWVADLMVDYDPRIDKPFAFMSSSFDKTYPLIIWALKLHMDDERFDIPPAGLHAVPLHEAFSWAYTHFVLEDHSPFHGGKKEFTPQSLTSQVLEYAAAGV